MAPVLGANSVLEILELSVKRSALTKMTTLYILRPDSQTL